MKTYIELTQEQQGTAIDRCFEEILSSIIEDGVRFDDKSNGDDLQETIDNAGKEANDMQTPWFWKEYILDARYRPEQGHIVDDDGLYSVREHLKSMALRNAQESLYPEREEYVIDGIA